MSTERIVLHGCSGSGKSTLARRLGCATGLPVIELDAIFHQPGWMELPEDDFRTAVTAALDTADADCGGWIVDGNYDSSLQGLVRARADVVIWFDLPRWQVTWRIVHRTLRRALFREELWNGNRERWSNIIRWDPAHSIIRWTWTRHHVYRERLRTGAASHASGQRWIRIRSNSDADAVLQEFAC